MGNKTEKTINKTQNSKNEDPSTFIILTKQFFKKRILIFFI